jgi:hypothetical protein
MSKPRAELGAASPGELQRDWTETGCSGVHCTFVDDSIGLNQAGLAVCHQGNLDVA